MSWLPTADPAAQEICPAGIDLILFPRIRDLGDGFQVGRVLPSTKRKTVGPFIFFDQMGPAEILKPETLEVRPHPHIGLATVTYLLDGRITHKDSLGTEAEIVPGDVNWMTAGRGVVHSERTSTASNPIGGALFGLQAWVALPKAAEESEPDFSHTASADLPVVEGEGVHARIILGSLFGRTSAVATRGDPIYADVTMQAGAKLELPAAMEDRAAYLISGRIEVDDKGFDTAQLLVFKPGLPITLSASSDARLMLLGGEPLDGPRYIWWNFVASSQERIEAAKADWRAGKFPAVPGEREFIPLPPA